MADVTCSPDPPVAGKPATFCLSPAPAGAAVITVSFEPGGTVELDVSKEGPCASVPSVPGDAESCVAASPGYVAFASPVEAA